MSQSFLIIVIIGIAKIEKKCHLGNMKQPSFQEALSFLLEAVSGTPNLPLRAFDDVFPELASLGRCYLNISDVSPSHLNGRYRVVDLYCQAPSCNCSKVSLMFLNKDKKVCATIAYGWKSKTFYRKWGLDKEMIQSLTHGFLDPWGQQSEHASVFLEAFLFTLKKDRNFIASLKQRYAFFKEALEDDPSLIKIFPEEKFPENVVPLKSFKGR